MLIFAMVIIGLIRIYKDEIAKKRAEFDAVRDTLNETVRAGEGVTMHTVLTLAKQRLRSYGDIAAAMQHVLDGKVDGFTAFGKRWVLDMPREVTIANMALAALAPKPLARKPARKAKSKAKRSNIARRIVKLRNGKTRRETSAEARKRLGL
jgi:hypothetical protein